MSDRIDDLPKKDPRRNAVARQIRGARKIDQRLTHSDYADTSTRNRGGDHYLNVLNGLHGFFKHVRTLPSHTVIDIGSGTTRGVAELSRYTELRDIDFRATALSHDKRIRDNLGRDKTRYTSVETLKGFANESIGGIIGAYSIAYSADPDLAIAGIDRVLVPGGIMKARFRSKLALENINLGFKHAAIFIEALRKRGYDVAEDGKAQVIVAIKPGQQNSPNNARSVLEADSKSIDIASKEHVKRILESDS